MYKIYSYKNVSVGEEPKNCSQINLSLLEFLNFGRIKYANFNITIFYKFPGIFKVD